MNIKPNLTKAIREAKNSGNPYINSLAVVCEILVEKINDLEERLEEIEDSDDNQDYTRNPKTNS